MAAATQQASAAAAALVELALGRGKAVEELGPEEGWRVIIECLKPVIEGPPAG